MKKLILILSILALLNSCKRPLSPRDGDLLFCIADSSDFSRSIVESTRSHSELQFDHVAIFRYLEGEAGSSPNGLAASRNLKYIDINQYLNKIQSL